MLFGGKAGNDAQDQVPLYDPALDLSSYGVGPSNRGAQDLSYADEDGYDFFDHFRDIPFDAEQSLDNLPPAPR